MNNLEIVTVQKFLHVRGEHRVSMEAQMLVSKQLSDSEYDDSLSSSSLWPSFNSAIFRFPFSSAYKQQR